MQVVSNIPGGKSFFKLQSEQKSKQLLEDLIRIVFSKWAVNRQQQNEIVVPAFETRASSQA
jgi:hypothetical protein